MLDEVRKIVTNNVRVQTEGEITAADRPGVRYVGFRTADGTTVNREDDSGVSQPLPFRTEVRNHSPTGLEWGYSGSGPAQLALAILTDAIGPGRAVDLYQEFKFQVVVGFPAERWELTREAVIRWVAANEQPKADADAE